MSSGHPCKEVWRLDEVSSPHYHNISTHTLLAIWMTPCALITQTAFPRVSTPCMSSPSSPAASAASASSSRSASLRHDYCYSYDNGHQVRLGKVQQRWLRTDITACCSLNIMQLVACMAQVAYVLIRAQSTPKVLTRSTWKPTRDRCTPLRRSVHRHGAPAEHRRTAVHSRQQWGCCGVRRWPTSALHCL
jgi:hypothetical protein